MVGGVVDSGDGARDGSRDHDGQSNRNGEGDRVGGGVSLAELELRIGGEVALIAAQTAFLKAAVAAAPVLTHALMAAGRMPVVKAPGQDAGEWVLAGIVDVDGQRQAGFRAGARFIVASVRTSLPDGGGLVVDVGAHCVRIRSGAGVEKEQCLAGQKGGRP
jgi:hypothetical protein